MTQSPLGPDEVDHLPVATLRDRIRSLTAEQLSGLRDYEAAHANRPQVISIMDARLDQLERGATPSPGDQQHQPERVDGPSAGSGVSDASAAPPTHPPPHGQPAQPGKPKGDQT